MTKQEIIIEHWSNLGITKGAEKYCDNNGFIDVNYLHKKDINSLLEFKEYEEYENNYKTMLCRPKSLKGIENNNGWIKIEKDNLPKQADKYSETERYFVLTKNNKIIIAPNINLWYWRIHYTHFKQIEIPKQPIY